MLDHDLHVWIMFVFGAESIISTLEVSRSPAREFIHMFWIVRVDCVLAVLLILGNTARISAGHTIFILVALSAVVPASGYAITTEAMLPAIFLCSLYIPLDHLVQHNKMLQLQAFVTPKDEVSVILY